jgi:hypothetical protein
MLGAVPVPLLDQPTRERIGSLVLQASGLRNRAWELERGAIAALEAQSGQGAG